MNQTKRIQPNGAICDRCQKELTTHAYALIDSYEYVCDRCLTPAEVVAYSTMPLEATA
jgi:uncharacterized CHY-type Zn-finger protein